MLKHYFILLWILIEVSCTKIGVCHLSMQRLDYTSNELNIQGYFYTKTQDGLTHPEFFLYRNGVIQRLGGSGFTLDELLEEESKWFATESILQRKDCQYCWGIFLIYQEQIALEQWFPSSGGPAPIYRSEGIITSDTTFTLRQYESCYGKGGTEETIYYLKRFPTKPDSTNSYTE